MRILVDYRSALRERTGVGEYIHQLIAAYTRAHSDDLAVFTSSWKDRPPADLSEQLRARVIDRRVPVTLLNYAWHRLEWPPAEWLAGQADVVHAAHPLLIPTRAAAQVVTIHDLFFLAEPLRVRYEVRRDYVPLVATHARRAHAVITSTEHGKQLVTEKLGVLAERIYVCPPGAPTWRTLGREPRATPNGHILFLGTLEGRKNIGVLLDAYEILVHRHANPPPLILAGRPTEDAAPWLRRIGVAPLADHVLHLGYVAPDDRERLLAEARVLVLPSLDEGFGLPVLEAMSAGVPVIAARRGALPEVLGGAGVVVEPHDTDALADALERLIDDDELARERSGAGLARAAEFTWARTATTLRQAYLDAVLRKQT
jgi:glycosyltransferase involved in cell wall biosynthesis